MHATDFLAKNMTLDGVPVLALYGTERYLKLEILKRIPGCGDDDDHADVELTRTSGKDTDLRSVCDELLTVSMFGDRRIVMIEEADDFVTAHRVGLEKYAAQPATSSLLILDVKKWPKNTKLFKAIERTGLNLDCGEIKGAALTRWLMKTATEVHHKSLDQNTAALIIQLAGDSLGLLQQELNKLVALVGDVDTITPEDVTRVVGGWRIETTWAMLDAIRDGHVGRALDYLDKLLMSGDAPQKVLGGLTFSFRKLADATELARQTRDLPGALRTSGVFPAAIGPSEAYLRRIGFDKASQILQWLVKADTDMKGGSRVDPKVQLEVLFVKLAG
ncbi:MAG: DNA polymerase III subunit delta [Planctomycetaceae bacterium]